VTNTNRHSHCYCIHLSKLSRYPGIHPTSATARNPSRNFKSIQSPCSAQHWPLIRVIILSLLRKNGKNCKIPNEVKVFVNSSICHISEPSRRNIDRLRSWLSPPDWTGLQRNNPACIAMPRGYHMDNHLRLHLDRPDPATARTSCRDQGTQPWPCKVARHLLTRDCSTWRSNLRPMCSNDDVEQPINL
jgi:hypothetical protein